MKVRYLSNGWFAVLAVLALIGCASAPTKAGDTPETVLVTYHVKSGREGELQKELAEAWTLYRNERLVFAQPHVLTSAKEAGGQTRMVEILTWVSHEAPDHVPASIRAVWERMQGLCEAREGREGIKISEVELLLPKAGK